MAEESLGSTTLYKQGELTKEEYLERQLWTLQLYFEEVLDEDPDAALDFGPIRRFMVASMALSGRATHTDECLL